MELMQEIKAQAQPLLKRHNCWPKVGLRIYGPRHLSMQLNLVHNPVQCKTGVDQDDPSNEQPVFLFHNSQCGPSAAQGES